MMSIGIEEKIELYFHVQLTCRNDHDKLIMTEFNHADTTERKSVNAVDPHDIKPYQ